MKRSHSRWTYRLDHSLPLRTHQNLKKNLDRSLTYAGTQAQKRVTRDMHNSKQRQWNKHVINNELNDME